MGFIVLELIRDHSGFLTGVEAIDPSTIKVGEYGGYVQVINGHPVQYFSSDRIVVADVQDGELDSKS